MTSYRYPPRAVRGDFVRSVTGLALTLGPMLLARPAPLMMALLGACAVVFAGHGVRTWIKSATRIEVDDEGISSRGPRNATLRWNGLERMSLDYYSTRRDRAGGWMQMKLSGEGARIRVDSALEGFESVVARAAGAAAARGIALAPATAANLATLGIGRGLEAGKRTGIWPTS